MKKNVLFMILMAVGTAVIFTACRQSPVSGANAVQPIDTVGLAAFQQAKLKSATQEKGAVAPTKTIVYRNVPAPVQGTYQSNDQNDAKSVTVEKKGWSKAAKGATIGAGAGAVAGAVINKKNRAVGAAIGAAIGAGGGYAVGRTMDKKDGRY